MRNRVLVLTMLLAAAGMLRAQDQTTANPYEGTSTPPPDTTITTTPAAKPPAGVPAAPATAAPQTPAPQQDPVAQPAASSTDPAVNFPNPDATPATASGQSGSANPDGGTVQPPPVQLATRPADYDPDGDIVHPQPLGANELPEGATIQMRLLSRITSAEAQRGDEFRGRVAYDVLRDGQVMIPAGAEIEGHIVMASRGHFGGSGGLRLRPETLILASGARFHFYAQVTGAPASRNRVGEEGVIKPRPRVMRDAIELGGGAAVGATTGAIVAGPTGAVVGSVAGLGAVTAHLLISHPQATLENGDVLVLTLDERLNLVSSQSTGN